MLSSKNKRIGMLLSKTFEQVVINFHKNQWSDCIIVIQQWIIFSQCKENIILILGFYNYQWLSLGGYVCLNLTLRHKPDLSQDPSILILPQTEVHKHLLDSEASLFCNSLIFARRPQDAYNESLTVKTLFIYPSKAKYRLEMGQFLFLFTNPSSVSSVIV